MIGVYAAALAVCGASLAIGQGALALCGMRRWSWLAPAVGLALVAAICWGTVRLSGHGSISAVAILVLAVAAAVFLRHRVEGGAEALKVGLPIGLLALAAASLPFLAEGHFGILGTGFNPDMSQHLFASDRLAHDAGSQLLRQGYPLGPHAIVVALHSGLGIGLVQGFSGLTVAVTVLAPLTVLTAFAQTPPLRRTAAALLVGVPYLVASYFAQGAFKETMEALFVLAFALALRESGRPDWKAWPLRLVPAALIAVGAVYIYSFPGLIWLAGTAVLWFFLQRWFEDRSVRPGSSIARPALLALTVFLVGALPELGRMIDFRNFETFNPNGPGLGNLFGQISPLEVLGIWPSGDFRVSPGGGAVPAVVYYAGAVFAAALLLYGAVACWRRHESGLLAGIVVAAGTYLAARVGGTPYTAAKALEVAAPLVTLVIVLALAEPGGASSRPPLWRARVGNGATAFSLASAAYVVVAAGCSLLALVNAPVGPVSYSPALTELRPLIASGSTLVLASNQLLDDENGARYIAWELRGGRVCIQSAAGAGGSPPAEVQFVISEGTSRQPPFSGLHIVRAAGPYLLWERSGPIRSPSPCPLIAVRQARQGSQR
ncbi:MAG: hypothetical protein WBM00_11810 [Solirubrobacterales bacterium]